MNNFSNSHNRPSAPSASSASSTPSAFDATQLLTHLDALFATHAEPTTIESYLLQTLDDAEQTGDHSAQLTVLNELMGFYRSTGNHTRNQHIIHQAINLYDSMQLQDSVAGTTTLINIATSLRAAGEYTQAKHYYQEALAQAEHTYQPTDRNLAALHNNLSIFYSETGNITSAIDELSQALAILQAASIDATRDVDIAATHTNLALLLLQNAHNSQDLQKAEKHAHTSIQIYQAGGNEHQPHYASALAGLAQVQYAQGLLSDALSSYQEALEILEQCYGKTSDSYKITYENYEQVRNEISTLSAQKSQTTTTATTTHAKSSHKNVGAHHQHHELPAQNHDASSKHTPGLAIARNCWLRYGKALLDEPRFAPYRSRIAAGLVGHGSERYGFDDEYSTDHDFMPGFYLWLTDDDYAAIGEELQAAYDALHFADLSSINSPTTPRAQGTSKRVGVISIGTFFEQITGMRQAPDQSELLLWLSLDEATLAAATNGAIFADPLGAFSHTRQAFKMMPEDVRLYLISQRLGMMAQAGQYNVARMLKRGDGHAAWLCINEFVHATASLVFLINNPISVGYLPYYKWQFAALRKLSKRMASRLPHVVDQLSELLQLSGAACFAGDSFGEGGKGSLPAQQRISSIIEEICLSVVQELQIQGLSTCDETFLEWQRPYVEAHIQSDAAFLHSL